MAKREELESLSMYCVFLRGDTIYVSIDIHRCLVELLIRGDRVFNGSLLEATERERLHKGAGILWHLIIDPKAPTVPLVLYLSEPVLQEEKSRLKHIETISVVLRKDAEGNYGAIELEKKALSIKSSRY